MDVDKTRQQPSAVHNSLHSLCCRPSRRLSPQPPPVDPERALLALGQSDTAYTHDHDYEPTRPSRSAPVFASLCPTGSTGSAALSSPAVAHGWSVCDQLTCGHDATPPPTTPTTGPTTPPTGARPLSVPVGVGAGHHMFPPMVGAPDIPSAAPAPVPDEEKRKRAGVVVRGARRGLGGGVLLWRVGRASTPSRSGREPGACLF